MIFDGIHNLQKLIVVDCVVCLVSEKMDIDYFIEDLRVIDNITEVENLMPLMRRVKHYKIRRNPLEELQEGEFKKKYRFSKHTAAMIIDMVKNNLAGDARGGFIPPHLKVLAAIRTWARGEVKLILYILYIIS